MSQVQTVNLKGNEYALVPQRLKQFREDNPRSDIQSKPHWSDDGSLDFETRVIKDQKDEFSAKSTGWAHYSAEEMKQPKAFEKLQTVSTGRALASMGYLNNGQIATSEEMIEFEEYKMEQILEEINNAEKREDFKEILAKLTPQQKQEVTPFINQRIQEIKDGNPS